MDENIKICKIMREEIYIDDPNFKYTWNIISCGKMEFLDVFFNSKREAIDYAISQGYTIEGIYGNIR